MREEQWMSVLGMDRDIERVARHMEMEWPEVVDSWQDMANDIMTRLVKDNQAVTVANLEYKARKKVLHRIGQQIASAMRDDYEHFTGNFLYSTGEIRSILSSGILSGLSEVVEGGEVDDARSWVYNGVKQTRTRLEHVDVLNAYMDLEKSHQTWLIRRFVNNEVIDSANDRKSVTRAVDRLTDILNRKRRRSVAEHNGPGARKAVRNTQSRQET